ncbi:tetraspanin-9 [Hydra vulgaris]|uniref:Tetraspanin n=1 Tax=Hydra vulgaris TaxID=6087 RepID=A0ABM4CQM0_HYDVU
MSDSYSEFGAPLQSATNSNNVVTIVGECAYKCIQFAFFIFNALYFIVGGTVLSFGIWLHINRKLGVVEYVHLTGLSVYLNGELFLIVVGIVTCLSSTIGFCGLRGTNLCIIVSYTVLLLITLATQLAVLIITNIYKNHIEKQLSSSFYNALNKYAEPNFESLTQSIDILQKSFGCCGSDTYKDWLKTNWGYLHNNTVPKSCCLMPYEKLCNKNISENQSYIYLNGCHYYIRKYLIENLHIIGGFGVWIIILEVLCIFFSIYLIIQIRKEESNAKIGQLEDFYDENYFKDE